jgi:hypothetical protein
MSTISPALWMRGLALASLDRAFERDIRVRASRDPMV